MLKTVHVLSYAMTQSIAALAFVGLACIGNGNTLPSTHWQEQVSSNGERSDSQVNTEARRLAQVLFALQKFAGAWRCVGPGHNLGTVYRIGKRVGRAGTRMQVLTSNTVDMPDEAKSEPKSFAQLYSDRLPSWLIERAAALGYTVPTQVQADALDAVLDGDDVIVQAKTGSGKTLSYLLPLLAMLETRPSVQALVVLPTRELATQVAVVARQLAAGCPERLMVMTLLDGSGATRQKKWIVAEPPQVIVGNVEQIDSVLTSRLFRLDLLKLLVVDEVDECLSDDHTCRILQRVLGGHLAIRWSDIVREEDERNWKTSRRQKTLRDLRNGAGGSDHNRGISDRQTLFVSATIPQARHFRKRCKEQCWCRDWPVVIHSEPEELVPKQLRHAYAPCTQAKRLAALRVLLRQHSSNITAALVFIDPSMPLRRIADNLAGIIDEEAPGLLSEDQPNPKRAAAVRAVKMGSRRLLITTPLGSRGLDIPHCSHIFIWGLPKNAEAYTHTAGRCGRNGRPGLVTVLADPREEFALIRLGNELGIRFHDARKSESEQEKSAPSFKESLLSPIDHEAYRREVEELESSW